MNRLSLVLLAGVVFLCFAVHAEGAITFTELGDWDKSILGGAVTVNVKSATGSGGVTYVNGIGGVIVDNTFRSVGAVPLATLQLSGGGTDFDPDGTADQTILGFALEGVVESLVGNQAVVRFTAGAYGITTSSSFVSDDPTSWGLVGIDGAGDPIFIDPFSSGILKDPESILPGDIDARVVIADVSEVQRISGVVANNQDLSGILLALQLDETDARLVDPTTFTLPPGFFQEADEVAIVFDQVAETIQTPASSSYDIGASEVDELNTMFLGLFAYTGLTPTSAFGWADGFGGGDDSYDPTGDPTDGDFPTSLDTTVDVPGIQAIVPEPASVIVWMLIGLAGVLLIRRRK